MRCIYVCMFVCVCVNKKYVPETLSISILLEIESFPPYPELL